MADLFRITNSSVYKAIALEAHKLMTDQVAANRRPRDDGKEGWILTHETSRTSFKQAMIVIVFVGMWIDAVLHMRVVEKLGHDRLKELRKTQDRYEDKLIALGHSDADLLGRVTKFRAGRNDLAHEKAYKETNVVYRVAQVDADAAIALMSTISGLLTEPCA